MLNPDFKEFIELLNVNRVRYLVVGGYAVAVHGHPRYTKDIDIWLELDAQNAGRVLQVLEQFGFASLNVTTDDLLEPDQVIQLGYPPRRIDLLTTLGELDFDVCYVARLVVEVENVKVNFIDLENLKASKRTAGRLQDLADLENLA